MTDQMHSPSTWTPKPDRPPPVALTGALGWMRENLFSSWLNAFLTVASIYLLYSVIPPLVD